MVPFDRQIHCPCTGEDFMHMHRVLVLLCNAKILSFRRNGSKWLPAHLHVSLVTEGKTCTERDARSLGYKCMFQLQSLGRTAHHTLHSPAHTESMKLLTKLHPVSKKSSGIPIRSAYCTQEVNSPWTSHLCMAHHK
jgi:hypothetical protein